MRDSDWQSQAFLVSIQIPLRKPRTFSQESSSPNYKVDLPLYMDGELSAANCGQNQQRGEDRGVTRRRDCNHSAAWSIRVIVSTHRMVPMVALSHWVFAPVLFYAGIGLFLLRQSLRPSCRICLHRHRCPNRLRGVARFIKLPVCVREAAATKVPKS